MLEKPGNGIGSFVIAVEAVVGACPNMAVPVFEQLSDEIIGNAVRPFTDHAFARTVKTQHAIIKGAEPEKPISILNNSETRFATDVKYILEFHLCCRCLRQRHVGQPCEQCQQRQSNATAVSADAAHKRNE